MMIKKQTKWIRYTSLVIFLFALAFSGCEKDNDPNAPDLPPVSTLVMDYSDFTSTKSMEVPEDVKSLTANNWGWAATNVLVWNAVLTVNLIVPVASFYEAFNHEGVYQGNNEWVWSYNFMAGGASYKADLHGTLSETQVLWEMYISKEDTFTDFLWYTGSHNILRTEGQWILNGGPVNSTSYLQIDWTRDENNNTATIKYEIIDPALDEYESYIYYGRTNDLPLNLFYDIYIASSQNLIEIEWSETTKEGRVKDNEHFGDTSWYCWDSSLQDILCD